MIRRSTKHKPYRERKTNKKFYWWNFRRKLASEGRRGVCIRENTRYSALRNREHRFAVNSGGTTNKFCPSRYFTGRFFCGKTRRHISCLWASFFNLPQNHSGKERSNIKVFAKLFSKSGEIINPPMRRNGEYSEKRTRKNL